MRGFVAEEGLVGSKTVRKGASMLGLHLKYGLHGHHLPDSHRLGFWFGHVVFDQRAWVLLVILMFYAMVAATLYIMSGLGG
jgi:hypothetical protein